jgi:hypothetical protein
MPNVIWVWQISSLSLHTVIIQIKPIKQFEWSPTDHILIISTENSKLYSFTLTNVYVVELVTDTTSNLAINKIIWNCDGKSFTVSDKNFMVIGHPEINEENAEEDQNEYKEDNIGNSRSNVMTEQDNDNENESYSDQ